MEESKLTASAVFLRTPFYPFNQLWEEKFDIADLEKNEFLEALYIASPDLYQKFIKEPATNTTDGDALRSVYKYYLRMSYRCTPFGYNTGVEAKGAGSARDRSNGYL